MLKLTSKKDKKLFFSLVTALMPTYMKSLEDYATIINPIVKLDKKNFTKLCHHYQIIEYQIYLQEPLDNTHEVNPQVNKSFISYVLDKPLSKVDWFSQLSSFDDINSYLIPTQDGEVYDEISYTIFSPVTTNKLIELCKNIQVEPEPRLALAIAEIGVKKKSAKKTSKIKPVKSIESKPSLYLQLQAIFQADNLTEKEKIRQIKVTLNQEPTTTIINAVAKPVASSDNKKDLILAYQNTKPYCSIRYAQSAMKRMKLIGYSVIEYQGGYALQATQAQATQAQAVQAQAVQITTPAEIINNIPNNFEVLNPQNPQPIPYQGNQISIMGELC